MIEGAIGKGGDRPLVGTVNFLGENFEIAVGNPPKEVVLPPHTILDANGNDTGKICPVQVGDVTVAKEPLYDNLYKIVNACRSTKILNGGSDSQCHRHKTICVGEDYS